MLVQAVESVAVVFATRWEQVRACTIAAHDPLNNSPLLLLLLYGHFLNRRAHAPSPHPRERCAVFYGVAMQMPIHFSSGEREAVFPGELLYREYVETCGSLLLQYTCKTI